MQGLVFMLWPLCNILCQTQLRIAEHFLYQLELFKMEYCVPLGLNQVSQWFRQYSVFNNMSALCEDLHGFHTTQHGKFQ